MTTVTQKIPAFRWTSQSIEVAARLGRGETWRALETTQLVSHPSLVRWNRHPEFQAAVTRHAIDIAAAIKAEGIANRQNRIDAYNERWAKQKQVIAERAASPEMVDVAGGASGLLVMTFKLLGSGEDAEVIREYAVDTGLLKEMRELEKQAAQDMKQWTEKPAQTLPDGATMREITIREIIVERPAPALNGRLALDSGVDE